jgi:hypothetical protein
MNRVLANARSKPIVYLMEHLLDYQRSKQYLKRYREACKWFDKGKRITKYAREFTVRLAGFASKLQVDVLQRTDTEVRARVQVSRHSPLTGYVEDTVDLANQLCKCPCRFQDEMGINYVHTKAVLLSIGKTTSWCNPRYQIKTYKECYSVTIPTMTMFGKLNTDVTFIPPEYKRPAGRPSKNRKERTWMRKTDKQNMCHACGAPGYMAKKCTAPSTQFRYNLNKEKALKWCRKSKEAELVE